MFVVILLIHNIWRQNGGSKWFYIYWELCRFSPCNSFMVLICEFWFLLWTWKTVNVKNSEQPATDRAWSFNHAMAAKLCILSSKSNTHAAVLFQKLHPLFIDTIPCLSRTCGCLNLTYRCCQSIGVILKSQTSWKWKSQDPASFPQPGFEPRSSCTVHQKKREF